MVMKKNTNKDLQKYLLTKLKSESTLSGTNSEQSTLNEMFIASLERMISEGPQGAVEFDTTNYLMNKLNMQDLKSLKHDEPNRTVFDEMGSTAYFQPANMNDQDIANDINQRQTLTYDNYVYSQKEKLNQIALDELVNQDIKGANDPKFSLIHSMSLAKRDAWLEIYNDYI